MSKGFIPGITIETTPILFKLFTEYSEIAHRYNDLNKRITEKVYDEDRPTLERLFEEAKTLDEGMLAWGTEAKVVYLKPPAEIIKSDDGNRYIEILEFFMNENTNSRTDLHYILQLQKSAYIHREDFNLAMSSYNTAKEGLDVALRSVKISHRGLIISMVGTVLAVVAIMISVLTRQPKIDGPSESFIQSPRSLDSTFSAHDSLPSISVPPDSFFHEPPGIKDTLKP